MSSRLLCIVPFCRATRGLRKGETQLPGEWICSKHWRLVSPATKAFKRRWYRLCRTDVFRWGTAKRPKRTGRLNITQWIGLRAYVIRRADAAWERCKVGAIEGAGGIG